MGGNVGHGLTYATNILDQFSKSNIQSLIFTALSDQRNVELKNYDNLYISRLSIKKYLHKSTYLKYGIFGDLSYGIMRLIYSIKMIHEFSIVAQKTKVIHFFDAEYIALFLFFRLFNNSSNKFIVNMHSSDFKWIKGRSLANNIYKSLLRFIVRDIISLSDVIYVHGESYKSQLIKTTRSTSYSNKIRMIPYGIGTDITNNEVFTKGEAIRLLNLNANTVYGLFFGVVRRSKGIIELLHHLSGYKHNRFQLIIAGSPGDISEKELSDIIKKLNIEEKIVCHLWYINEEEISKYFYATDFIFIPHTKSHGGFSGPLALAAQYSLPVFASNHEQISKYVEEYNLGIIYENSNFGIQLQYMLQNLELVKQQADFKRCQAQNSWSNLASIFISDYGRICA